MNMSNKPPLIGSRISLISKKDIRYVGFLYDINTSEATVALQDVRSFGTEHRPVPQFVPPADTIYPFIKFRGSDINDLHIHDSQPTDGEGPLQQLMGGKPQPPQQEPAPALLTGLGGFPTAISPPGVLSTASLAPGPLLNQPLSVSTPPVPPSTLWSPPVPSSMPLPPPPSASFGSFAATVAPITSQTLTHTAKAENGGAAQLEVGGRSGTDSIRRPPNKGRGGAPQGSSGRNAPRMQSSNPKVPGASGSRSGAMPGTGASLLTRKPKGLDKEHRNALSAEMSEDFDFSSAAEDFDKKKEAEKLAALGSSITAEGDSSKKYNPSASFFDELSCDALDRGGKRFDSQTRLDEQKKNSETFGAVGLQDNRRSRGARGQRNNNAQNQQHSQQHGQQHSQQQHSQQHSQQHNQQRMNTNSQARNGVSTQGQYNNGNAGGRGFNSSSRGGSRQRGGRYGQSTTRAVNNAAPGTSGYVPPGSAVVGGANTGNRGRRRNPRNRRRAANNGNSNN